MEGKPGQARLHGAEAPASRALRLPLQGRDGRRTSTARRRLLQRLRHDGAAAGHRGDPVRALWGLGHPDGHGVRDGAVVSDGQLAAVG